MFQGYNGVAAFQKTAGDDADQFIRPVAGGDAIRIQPVVSCKCFIHLPGQRIRVSVQRQGGNSLSDLPTQFPRQGNVGFIGIQPDLICALNGIIGYQIRQLLIQLILHSILSFRSILCKPYLDGIGVGGQSLPLCDQNNVILCVRQSFLGVVHITGTL